MWQRFIKIRVFINVILYILALSFQKLLTKVKSISRNLRHHILISTTTSQIILHLFNFRCIQFRFIKRFRTVIFISRKDLFINTSTCSLLSSFFFLACLFTIWRLNLYLILRVRNIRRLRRLIWSALGE